MTPVIRHALGATALLCTALLGAACGPSSSNSGTSLGSNSPSAPVPSTAPATSSAPSAPASGSAGVRRLRLAGPEGEG